MAELLSTPLHCIQHSRFMQQDDWRLSDLSLSQCGTIAVTGFNNKDHRTSIDVYSARNSVDKETPNTFFTKEFAKFESDGRVCRLRCVSLVGDDKLVSCLGNKLEVLQLSEDKVAISCRVNGKSRCLSVREKEIFIGFFQSNQISVYNLMDLSKIKSIVLRDFADSVYPFDMMAIAGNIFVCVRDFQDEKKNIPFIIEGKSGTILSQLTKPTDVHWHARSVTVCTMLNVVAVLWSESYYYVGGGLAKIAFYPLLNENSSSFLVCKTESCFSRIRMSARGDRMIAGNMDTGEVKIYDMADLITYSNLKEQLGSQLKMEECVRLAEFFSLSKEVTYIIEKSGIPGDILLLALEGKNVVQESNLGRLTDAFHKLEMRPSYNQVTEFFQKTRRSAVAHVATGDLTEFPMQMNDESEAKAANKPEPEANATKLPALLLLAPVHNLALAFWVRHKASDGRTYFYNSATKQSTWDNPECPQSKAESSANRGPLYLNLSKQDSEFLQVSSFEEEFAKLSVRVSEKLTKANCVKLATYLNFPTSKMDLIRNDFETPGITLFDAMKERHTINVHNVMSLKEALEELNLKDISDSLVTPYQRRIDRLRFEQGYLSPE